MKSPIALSLKTPDTPQDATLLAPRREALLRTLSATTFLIFVQAYLVAPLIPAFSLEFHATHTQLAWLVPIYMLPYGISTLVYGPFSDRVGRKPVILSLLILMVLVTAGVATSRSMSQMLLWRLLGGLATGGIVPIALALLGDLFPYAQRGRAMGWMFGAAAGGMAFGSTFGVLLNPITGWRVEFIIIAVFEAIAFAATFHLRSSFDRAQHHHPFALRDIITGYVSLYRDRRAAKGYMYILANGAFHSGIFSWLGLYFADIYHLGDKGIGLALLGYGMPGMLLGPSIGRAADRFGRRWIIPFGIVSAAGAAALLARDTKLVWAAVTVAFLSLGYDMSHPLLAGIITSVNPKRRGLAMGMNAFALFTGFGLGPLLFGLLANRGFNSALIAFAAVQLGLGLLAIPLFKSEVTSSGKGIGTLSEGVRLEGAGNVTAG